MPYGKQPTMSEVWARVRWNLRHLLDFKTHNPYLTDGMGGLRPKHRTGLEDLLHSLEDVYREWRRLRAAG